MLNTNMRKKGRSKQGIVIDNKSSHSRPSLTRIPPLITIHTFFLTNTQSPPTMDPVRETPHPIHASISCTRYTRKMHHVLDPSHAVTPLTPRMSFTPLPTSFCHTTSLSKLLFAVIPSMAEYISAQTGQIHIDLHGRSLDDLSVLARDRLLYKPRYPKCLDNPDTTSVPVSFPSHS